MRIEGVSALVAGGASGLGEATARMLVAGGAAVTIADLNAEKGAALAKELGPSADFAQADVTDEASMSAAVERAATHDDGLRISVCCAGIGWAERVAHKAGPHNLEFFSNVVKVNLIGTFNVLRLAAAAMSDNEPDDEGERGVCVNTASIAAYDGQIGQAAYAASKGGIVGLTLPAARDMAGRGVRVVTVAPGLFDTPLLAALPEEAREALGAGIPFPSRLPRCLSSPGLGIVEFFHDDLGLLHLATPVHVEVSEQAADSYRHEHRADGERDGHPRNGGLQAADRRQGRRDRDPDRDSASSTPHGRGLRALAFAADRMSLTARVVEGGRVALRGCLV
jgi:3-hydroxyacyl-CoA dehydrogenase/3-hydroxy-2-methylbutyryl-CoA dehydrogenase